MTQKKDDKTKMKENKETKMDSKDKKVIEELENKLNQTMDQYDDLKSTLQNVQAEFENYKKRQDRDHEARVQMSSADIILKILPIVDDFEHSLNNLKKSLENVDESETEIKADAKSSDDKNLKTHEDIIKGFELIYGNLLSVLKKEGLEEINPVGERFDPYLHEAVMQVESDKEPMTVLEVWQKGYRLKDRIIRYAKVKVAK